MELAIIQLAFCPKKEGYTRFDLLWKLVDKTQKSKQEYSHEID